ncbi:MAG TPA: hypothetical protein VF397_16145 [Pyrinomonadaceae bacterium]
MTAIAAGESRTLLLTIVRNTCYSWLQRNRARELTDSIDETEVEASDFTNPELRLVGHLGSESRGAATVCSAVGEIVETSQWPPSR